MSTHHYHDNLRDKNNVCANVFVKKNASDNITYHSSVKLCNRLSHTELQKQTKKRLHS